MVAILAAHYLSAIRQAMAEKRPFLEDGSQFGVSRTAFRRMRTNEKHELMVQWFHQNFEDPAQRTSYVTAEGGYLWNHGGPHDAREELFDMFGKFASEKLIEEVAEAVEAEGITEWASARDDDYYDDDDGQSPDFISFDKYSDLPTDHYGSQGDLEARERTRVALQDLLAILDQPKAVGIGHNNPPEEIDDTEEVEALRKDVVALQIEFNKPSPAISFVKMVGKALLKASLASVKWVGSKIDLAVNTAITKGIPVAGAVLTAKYSDQLHKVLDAVVSWLDIVAHKF